MKLYAQVILGKSGYRHLDLVAIFAALLNVVWRVGRNVEENFLRNFWLAVG
jgi:hypothetical protein